METEELYAQVETISAAAAATMDMTDPAAFDSMTAQLVQAGIPVDEERTRSVREQSPNTVAVFTDEYGDLCYLQWDRATGTFATFYYHDGSPIAELQSETEALEESARHSKAPLIQKDLEPLRSFTKDGMRFYDDEDVYQVQRKKEDAREVRREELRTVTLSLPDEFLNLCEECQVEPAAVLRGFVADLCHLREGEYITNGSDERDLAEQYFERCGYPYMAQEP